MADRLAKLESIKKTAEILNQKNRSRSRLPRTNSLGRIKPRIIDFDSPKEENKLIDALDLSVLTKKTKKNMSFDLHKYRKYIDSTKEFSGEKRDVKKFLNNVKFIFDSIPQETEAEIIENLLNYTISRLCPSEIYSKAKQKEIKNFEDFQNVLVEIVYGVAEINDINFTLDSTKQRQTETINDYAARIKELSLSLDIALKKINIEGETAKTLSTTFLYNAFVRNLRPELNKICLAKGLKTIEECVEDIQKIEKLVSSDKPEKSPYKPGQNIQNKQHTHSYQNNDKKINSPNQKTWQQNTWKNPNPYPWQPRIQNNFQPRNQNSWNPSNPPKWPIQKTNWQQPRTWEKVEGNNQNPQRRNGFFSQNQNQTQTNSQSQGQNPNDSNFPKQGENNIHFPAGNSRTPQAKN